MKLAKLDKNKINLGLKRVFSNDYLTFRVYLVWGVITIVVVCLFGLIPASESLIDNFKIANEMKKTNAELGNKIDKLQKLKEDLDTISQYTDTFEKNFPEYYDAQNHMVELSFLSERAGFDLDNFNPNGFTGNEVSVSLKVSGSGDLYNLLKSIESAPRLSEVTNIQVNKSTDTIESNMSLKTFIFGASEKE